MIIRRAPDIRASEITDERLYFGRRDFIKVASAAGMGAVLGTAAPAALASGQEPLTGVKAGLFGTDEKWTPFEDITNYNNFYEFGSNKEDSARYASRMKTRPWTVKIEGQLHAPGAEFHLDDLLKPHTLEERVHRLRCVEGWSMVVPWVGFPLGDLVKRFRPTSDALFVEFQTLYRPSEMRGQREPVPLTPSAALRSQRSSSAISGQFGPLESFLEWPYVEGLRMDEATHPLTILAVGLYGKTLLNQNGAPLRLVVPWKYGFKSIKSIVKIRFVKNRPRTSWNLASPREFGFYANVNPDVHRPTVQTTERRLGEFFRRRTLMFNGYGDQVAQMYEKMDLTRDY